MIILISKNQRDAELKAFGFKETEFIDQATGIEVWEHDGKFYAPPPPHENGNGNQYCPLGLRLFFKHIAGSSDVLEMKGYSDLKFVISPEKK